jgi:hypothetical protein
VDPARQVLAATGAAGQFQVSRTADFAKPETCAWHGREVLALAWAGRTLVSADAAGRVALWDWGRD